MIKKIGWLVAGSLMLAGCATNGNMAVNDIPDTTAGAGERYLLGHGVPQDNQKAFQYFSQAAKDGDVFAQNELAYLYAAGKGTPRNNQKALFWYQSAAKHGLASAQYNLGLMYWYGIGTVKDQAKAMKCFKQSAARHFEPAILAVKKYQG